MANNRSAEKRNRQNIPRNERNRAARSKMRNAIKKVRSALEQGEVATAEAALPAALQLVDKSATKGVIHRNTADRTKSRLTKAVAAAKG